MKMDVKDTLTRPLPAIEHHTEAILRDPVISGQLIRRKKNITEESLVSLLYV